MHRNDPWTWTPPLAPWFEGLERRLAAWSPKRIEVERIEAFRAALAAAAAERADWLYHPFCTTLRGDGQLSGTFGEAQVVGWAAAHLPGLGGLVQIDGGERLWRGDGTASALSGSLAVSDLAALVASGRPGEAISRRPLLLLPQGDGDAPESRFIRETLDSLLGALPRVEAWLCTRTRALDLLPEGFFATAPDGALVSCSSPEVPGFIRISRTGEILKLLEMVVHETAHLHLFVGEAAAPLVDGAAADAVFSSPIRHEPRPLRGILLALHACAYIAAAFAEAKRSRLECAPEADGERLRVLALFEESRDIVTAAAAHLTPHGLDFVARTDAVADFAYAA